MIFLPLSPEENVKKKVTAHRGLLVRDVDDFLFWKSLSKGGHITKPNPDSLGGKEGGGGVGQKDRPSTFLPGWTAVSGNWPESWERLLAAGFLRGYRRTGGKEAALCRGLWGGAGRVTLEIRSTDASWDIRRGPGLPGMTPWHLWANGGC